MTHLTLKKIHQQALKLGWDDVGVTPAILSEDDIRAYREWLDNGLHADMAYMENQIRCYPQQLLPGAKTAIIFVTYYKQPPLPFREDAGLIASYARGRDYHHV